MTACRHCGLSVPPIPRGYDPAFCCAGCEAASALIEGVGLGDFYKRRTLDPNALPLRPDEDKTAFDLVPFTTENPDGTATLYLMVEGLQCAACVWLIETLLARTPGVVKARLNMTTRRLVLTWAPDKGKIDDIIATVTRLGYRILPYDPVLLELSTRKSQKELLRAMAVAGFAAANVMLLSVAVWSGAGDGTGGGVGPATQSLMHWLSAMIALPAILYAGRPFFRSALGALKARRTNMDVPISLALVLTGGMSLFETLRGGDHVYFESATMLLFFLLIGRFLDARARGRAHAQAERLTTLGATTVTIIDDDGHRKIVASTTVRPGMTALIAAGDRVPIDGDIISGASDLDCALITGEALPRPGAVGDMVYAGTINITAPLRVRVTATGQNTLLSEIARLMEVAEQGRGRYVILADRVARLYAPVVHGLALFAFLGWVGFTPLPWQDSLLIAVSVLIITCPCALALAVPIVHVVASARLMRRGILIKSASALERLANIDTIIFDKTGTLTTPNIILKNTDAIEDDALDLAARMAMTSTHPLARALARAKPNAKPADGVNETPGEGLAMMTAAGEVRLGRKSWCLDDSLPASNNGTEGAALWFSRPGVAPLSFQFDAPLRPDAIQVTGALRDKGYRLALLSGDRVASVRAVAQQTNIDDWRAEQRPDDKVRFLSELADQGRCTLMVGDGLNDAPALSTAHVSASPGEAADITRNAADMVFQGNKLSSLLEVISVTKNAGRLVRQNLFFAFLYNAVTIPLAVLGYVTPLIAAVAMSTSSLVVIVNALRLSNTNFKKAV